jgi:hypothetical protein
VPSRVNDTERLFVLRALWFARGFETPLPGFDQNVAIVRAHADERSWHSHVEEFEAIRAAKLPFFKSVRPDAWMRRGTASGNPGFHGGARGGRGHR